MIVSMEQDTVGGDDSDEVPVAVAVRVCPPPPVTNPFTQPQISVQVNTLTNQLYLGQDRQFSFDCLYGANSSQDEVFTSSVEPLLTPLLDGYNVAVIMYGAAGTGKTFTLVGPGLTPALDEESFGVIPRLVRSLFQELGGQSDTLSVVTVSYVEVHNEEVRDLLSDSLNTLHLESQDPLTNIQCEEVSEVLACLELGQSLHTGPGLGLDPGSHTVLTLSVTQQSGLLYKHSQLQFVDLAASDRLTAPSGAINLGLLSLGNVVSALGDPRRNVSYVPYSDSLLTRLLAPTLGGNCLTLLICCISSLSQDSEESLNSLLLSCRAANIKNSPQPNIVRRELLGPEPRRNSTASQQTYNTAYLSHQARHPLTPLSSSPLSFKSGAAPLDLYLPQNTADALHSHISPRQNSGEPFNYQMSPRQNTVESFNSHMTPRQNYQETFNSHMSPRQNSGEAFNSHMSPMLGNQGHIILNTNSIGTNLSPARPVSHNFYQDGIIDENSEEMLKLQFAASQYKALVSSAGDLLRSISLSEEVNMTEKKEIESWICKKEESEHAIKKSGDAEKVLDKIVEESEEDTEGSSQRTDQASLPSLDVVESVEEFDSECSDTSDIETRLEVVDLQFRQQTDSLVANAEVEFWHLMKEERPAKRQLQSISEEEFEAPAAVMSHSSKPDIASQIRKLSAETETQKSRVELADLDVGRLKVELEDLKTVIKSKEEYIKDLLTTGQQSEQAKVKLEEKLRSLEFVSQRTQRELMSAQMVLKDLESKSGNSLLESEYRSKVTRYRTEIEELQKKVKKTEAILILTQPEQGRIVELQENLSMLKDQHEKLQGKLVQEENRKQELESALFRDQEIINQLQQKLQHQEKLLKESIEASRDLNAKKQWLKREEERIAVMERAAKQLEDSLLERERQVKVRENRIQETSFGPDTSNTDVNLEMVNLTQSEAGHDKVRKEVDDLRMIRDILVMERQKLDDKLTDQNSLSQTEERKMVEIDESIEALDSAIEYKNEIICYKNVRYDETYDGDDVLMKRLVKLNVQETRALLHRYFMRVLDLRMEGKKMETHLEVVEEQYNDLGKYARSLGHSLQRTKLECERRLVAQERDHRAKINLMVQQLGEDKTDTKRIEKERREKEQYKKMYKELKRSQENENSRPVNSIQQQEEADMETSRSGSVMSNIQPSHVNAFFRRAAKLQKKMGDTPKPTVTREHRKLIIENPLSANNSIEKKPSSHRRK